MFQHTSLIKEMLKHQELTLSPKIIKHFKSTCGMLVIMSSAPET